MKSILTFTGLVLVALAASATTTAASVLVPQTALPGDCVPRFALPLPVFGPAGSMPRVQAARHRVLRVTMVETSQQVLPAGGDTCGLGVVFKPTRVWAYATADMRGRTLAPAHWPAVTIDARRFVPTEIEYVNALPSFGAGLVQGLLTVDQTIHWANPTAAACVDGPPRTDCETGGRSPFTGPVPAVVHLHGGEVPSAFDGGPEAWFAPDGAKGTTYASRRPAGAGAAIYRYPNGQQPGTLWFHDHALGTTRINVYSGLAAFYLLRDRHTEPRRLPHGPYEIEMLLQDRQFDTASQLFWPDGSGADVEHTSLNGPPPNPDRHPFWNPEFVGDVVTVNGAAWPFLVVEPRRYRLRLLDGSNARFYRLHFGSVPVYQIGADDAYLDAPVRVSEVFLAPGERADVIVDFAAFAGQEITVTNDAPVPYPDGLVPGTDQPGMADVMQFRVRAIPVKDTSCDPASPRRRGRPAPCGRPVPVVRLTDGNGRLAPGVQVDQRRQLVLKEFATEAGPVEVLLNNTQWDGLDSPAVRAAAPDGVTEKPRVGSTELWEIINLTDDAHPIHTHLAQFQILNRESFADAYRSAWGAAFGMPAGCVPSGDPENPCPGYGPPLPYAIPNADGAIGGNPAIGPFLMHDAQPPAAEEAGWKDTAKAYPGQVLRLLVRWAPTTTPVRAARPGRNRYPFDPTTGPGYVWHCHLLDHEDNEMMRPYAVLP